MIETKMLARLTAAKTVVGTALRWIPPFLPTLERAFGVSTTQMTTVLGLGETAGLSTVFVGPHLDRGRERIVMVSGLCAISLSSLIALGGTIWTFAIAFALVGLGAANFTVAGHAWISHRVDYRRRARSFGVFETSWALALLVGGPIIAVVINVFGWRGPFVLVAVASAIAAIGIAVSLSDPAAAHRPNTADGAESAPRRQPLTLRAWLVVIGSATMASAGLSIFVVSGSWLDDDYGVSTGGLGLIVMGFGGAELIGSTATATWADRIGKTRSSLGGLCCVGVGLVIMLNAGDRLWMAVAGLLVLLLGFEFGFVTSFSLVSEAMPDARGRTLAISNAISTMTRGSSTIVSGLCYGAWGIGGSAALSATAAGTAATCFVLSRRVG